VSLGDEEEIPSFSLRNFELERERRADESFSFVHVWIGDVGLSVRRVFRTPCGTQLSPRPKGTRSRDCCIP
jgi:hypothetical protein